MLSSQDLQQGDEKPEVAGEILLIPRSRIDRDDAQIRQFFPEEVVEARRNNIRANKIQGKGISGTGILTPLEVRLAPGYVDGRGKVKHNARFILIDGEMRYRATEDLLETLPCIVKDMSEREARRFMREMALQTTGYNPVEWGLMIAQKMADENLTIRQVAEEMGVNKSHIENHLAALELPDDLMGLVGRRKKSLSIALILREIKDDSLREEVTRDYEEKGWTKAEVRKIVDDLLNKRRPVKELTSRVLPDDPRFTQARERDVKYPVENYPPEPVNFDEYKGEIIGAPDLNLVGEIYRAIEASGPSTYESLKEEVLSTLPASLPPLRSSIDLGFDPADNFKAALNQLNHLYDALGVYERAETLPPAKVAAKVRYYCGEVEAMAKKLESRISRGHSELEAQNDLDTAAN